MGILKMIQKQREKQAVEETKNKIIETMASQGMDEATLKVISTIKAEDPAQLTTAIKNVQDFMGKTQKAQENQFGSTVAGRIIKQAQQPGGMEQLQVENPQGLKVSEGGVSMDIPSSIKGAMKTGEEKKKEAIKAENTATPTYRFLQQFQRSYDELKSFDPEVDKVGVGGYLSRAGAKIAEHLDELPETSALKIQVLPLANGMAREIEGGRVTDSDRKIYADSFANALNHPIKSNIRLMSQSLVSLLDKGGDANGKITEQLKQLSSTKSDIFNGVLEQIIVEYPDMAKKIFGENYEVVNEDKK